MRRGYEILEGALVESAVSLDVLGSTRTSRGFCFLLKSGPSCGTLSGALIALSNLFGVSEDMLLD